MSDESVTDLPSSNNNDNDDETIVHTTDDASEPVVLRGLTSSSSSSSSVVVDASAWAAFCASCFAHKRPTPPPASYFLRHFENDPDRDARLVRVALLNGEIASTLRVFVRTLSTGDGAAARAGGVGEVCTALRHRRRGLASALLRDAFAVVGGRFRCTALHASDPTIRVVYARQGFESVRTRFSSIDATPTNTPGDDANNEDGGVVVRPVDWDRDVDVLARVHRAYSESRFAGCVVRSDEYWREYVPGETADDGVWVMERDEEKGGGAPAAWLSVRRRSDGTWTTRDFGVDVSVTTAARAARVLLLAACRTDDEESVIRWNVSSVVLDEILDEEENEPGSSLVFDRDSREDQFDDGWMYKEMMEGTEKTKDPSFVRMVDVCKDTPHFIWPLDSF